MSHPALGSGLILWHINHCWLFNANPSYTYISNVWFVNKLFRKIFKRDWANFFCIQLNGSKYFYLLLIIYLFIFPWFQERKVSDLSRGWPEGSNRRSCHTRLLKWYLIYSCLTLSNIRYVSRVKWRNPEKGVAPSPTPRCSSYWKEKLLVPLIYGHQLLLTIQRFRGGRYSFPWIAPLYTWALPYNAEC